MTESNPAGDRLTGQLMYLPDIIGNLGLNIAEAQKRLDSNYLDGLGRFIQLIKANLGDKMLAAEAAPEAGVGGQNQPAAAENEPAAGEKTEKPPTRSILEALLASFAPSRYQFTETTLDFSADLAETRDQAFQAGIGVGLQAVVVNAAFSSAFGYDYRAGARITTKMHAIASNTQMTNSLLDRAKKLHGGAVSLPERSEVEERVWTRTGEIFDAVLGRPEEEKEEGGGGGDQGGAENSD